MRRTLLAPAGFLLLALAACMPSDEATQETASGTTPPPSPQEAPLPAPSAPAPAPAASAEGWTVTFRGAGPVQVGMPAAEAASTLGGGTPSPGSTCTYLRPASAPAGVKVMLNEGSVARVEVDSGSVRTAEGAGIGDTDARVREVYAGRVAETPHKYTSGRYLTVTPAAPADSTLRLVFETEGGKVTRYRAGRLPEVEWVEGCS